MLFLLGLSAILSLVTANSVNKEINRVKNGPAENVEAELKRLRRELAAVYIWSMASVAAWFWFGYRLTE